MNFHKVDTPPKLTLNSEIEHKEQVTNSLLIPSSYFPAYFDL